MNGSACMDPRTIVMSTAQLQMFLAAAGATGELSPLRDLPAAAAAPDDISTLESAGLLEAGGVLAAAWRPVAAALASPLLRLDLSAGGDAGAQRLQAVAGRETGELFVSFVERGPGEWAIAWPLAKEDFAAVMTAELALDGATIDPGVRLELTPEGFLALGAVLDALRDQELESLLARERTPASPLTPAAVGVALRLGLASEDYRWLVPVFRRLLPNPPTMDQAALERGLDELASAAVLCAAGDGEYGIVSAFEPVRRLLLAPLASGALRIIADADAGPTWSGLGAVRTLAGLWGVEPGAATVQLRTVDEGTLLAAFGAVVDTALAATARVERPSPAPAAPSSSRRFCGQCGAALRPEWKFCGACGASTQ